MSSKIANYLKVYTEESPEVVRPEIEAVRSLPELFRAFEQTTGWALHYVPGSSVEELDGSAWSAPVEPGMGVASGYLHVGSGEGAPDASTPAVDLETATDLASAIGRMLGELLRTQHVLWQREAELAAGVPLSAHGEEEKHLAARLEAVLKGGAEAIDCEAAALYLLDEATTELKLRSSWGLPLDRLTAPARPLQGAMADLEALLGHAVVLEDPQIMEKWAPPEPFASAVCVPLSTPTTLLGTLWVFCNRRRDFDDRQTNLIEIVAGRLAAELEREMLLREGLDGVQLKKQVAAAQRLQRGGLPMISPMLDGWELAGWTAQAQSVGGDFFDWFCLPEGLMAVAVGDAKTQGIEAALSAGSVKSALRSHGQYHQRADCLLGQVNLTLWTGSMGDQFADLFCGLVETSTGMVRFASAGQISAVLLREGQWESLPLAAPPLGESPETEYRQHEHQLQPGETLVVFTDGFRDAQDERGRPLGQAGLADPLAKQADRSAEDLVTLARDRLEAHAVAPERWDRTVLVLKRTAN